MNDQNKKILDNIFNSADCKTKSFHVSDKPKNIKIKVDEPILKVLLEGYEKKESMSDWYRQGGFSKSLGECYICDELVSENNGCYFTNLDKDEQTYLLHKTCLEQNKSKLCQ